MHDEFMRGFGLFSVYNEGMARYDEYLSFFKQDVIERAFQYFESDYVHDLKRVNGDIITASVEGTDSRPYDVKIDLARPYDSECSCPHAASGNMCKHMAAVFFAAFPEQAQAYEDYTEGRYLGEDDLDIEEDERDFLPANYDELLDEFIASMNSEEKEQLLRKVLKQNPLGTYHQYLEKLHQNALQNSSVRRADELHRMLTLKAPYYAGSYTDFTKPVLSEDIHQELENCHDDVLIGEMLKQFRDVRLYSYADAPWMAEYICRFDTEVQKNRFIVSLEEHAGFLEEEVHHPDCHPLNNVYKALYVLKREWNRDDLAYDLLKHLRYPEYASYVLDHEEHVSDLYRAFRNQMSRSIFNRKAVHAVLHQFADRMGDSSVHELADYYDYVYNFNRAAFDRLRNSPHFRDIVLPRLLKQKPHIVKETLAQLNRPDELFALLKKENDILGMIQHAPLLDASHHQELQDVFTGEFYRIVETADSREKYEHACQYIRALATLRNGEEIIDGIVNDLKKQDRYARRRALFEEIEKAR